MYYEYLLPELLEEEDPSFFEASEDLSVSPKWGYYPKQCPPYKCVTPCKPRYCPPKYPPCPPPCLPPCPPFKPQRPYCYPLYPLPQWPKQGYPCYPWKSYPPQWCWPRPFPCIPQKGCYPPCPPYWGRPCYPKCLPQYPCDFLEI